MSSRTRNRKMEPDYKRTLHAYIDAIFERSADIYGWQWPELARKAGISYATVRKLGSYETRFPEMRTVYLLAKAVGMDQLPIARKLLKISKAA